MTPELKSAIYTRSRLERRYNKNPTEENMTNCKKQRKKMLRNEEESHKNPF